ncbi:glycoside hydrolase family 95 protein [Tessaracoccus sp. OS52]|uniref:glycosyl hydrolase family 95 catalytic domain-containing protein n=1 Tax=Tessaracoccus sp. OS52 TaxID=2886691 RepID=UPI001D10196B|nr:glycoside hydrolase N-terminal domain-containing protein [Tessaracoccus sp. OS52]MCC2594448.1 glycoside hydrolase family 95 protein [Tessaracoccus sp. OS52]
MRPTTTATHAIVREAPARAWTEALPLGNGRQGLMVFGDDQAEQFHLNDSTAWSGGPAAELRGPTVTAEDARKALAEARAAIRDGRAADATPSLHRLQHRHTQAFLPLGALTVRFEGHVGERSHYERQLDLATATHTTTSTRGGWTLTQRTWVSQPAGVAVVEISTDRPDGLRVEVGHEAPWPVLEVAGGEGPRVVVMQLPSDVAPSHDPDEEPFVFDNDPLQAGRAAVVVDWRHDGVDDSAHGHLLAADGVSSATLWLTTATTFAGLGADGVRDFAEMLAEARDALAAASAVAPEELYEQHLSAHRELYDRCGIEVPEPVGADLLPGAATPGLLALLFNFGRYLLASCSRPGSPPANLQGIWNADPRPPWSSNYTTNINLPMNYWGADVANLPETVEPLLDLVDALPRSGRRTAETLHGAAGWAAHHNTDVWGYTLPVGHGQHDPSWAFWPFGGAWLLQGYRQHLDFGAATSSREELARRAWEPTAGAAEFVLSWSRPGPDGLLDTSPSTSPENQFLDATGRVASAGRSSTLDLGLSRDTLELLVLLAGILGRDDDPLVVRAREALPLIPQPSAGRDGAVREWIDDPEQVDPLHRHQSHLYFAYPGVAAVDDELEAAVRRSLDLRGDDSTGWSLAWRLALRARLRDAPAVTRLLRLVTRGMSEDRGGMSGGLYPNLFSAHPPFQIDGNLGYVAALAECLVQSHRGRVELLPALPEQLPTGRAWGLVARPGIVVDMEWSDGVLIGATLRARDGVARKVLVAYGDEERELEVGATPVAFTARVSSPVVE